jgi:alpha/beta superfamily hydrolase
MGRRLLLPGARDVRATLDDADGDGCVVACPPHPQMGGDRTDPRLRAVSDALGERGLACLRIDYGPWDEGRGERVDVRGALDWAREEYATTGLFGYSFGGSVALLAAASASRDQDGSVPEAVSVLAPARSIEHRDASADAAAAATTLACPLQVIHGSRDGTVDSSPVAEQARERGGTVERLAADHFYAGQQRRVGTLVADFLADTL